MKLLSHLALAAMLCSLAHARPVIVQETSTIESPDPEFNFGWRVGLDGDDAVVYGNKEIPDPYGTDDTLTRAFLFHRSGNTWNFVRVIAETRDSNEGDGVNSKGLDMRNGVIAASLQPMRIFERVNGDYVERTITNGIVDERRGDYVVVDGANRILFGGWCFGASLFERNADATWTDRATLPGDACFGDDGNSGGPVALAGEWAVVASPYNDAGELPSPAITFFHHTTGYNWPETERRVPPAGHGYGTVYMRGDELYVSDATIHGQWVYRRNASNQWTEVDRLRTENDYMWFDYSGITENFGATSQLVLQTARDYDLGKSVIHVFKKDGTGKYAHVATLVLKGDANDVWMNWFAIDGNHVLVGGVGRAHYFELPTNLTAPAAIQYAFPNTTVSGWTVLTGSQFALAPSGTTQVWRQSSTAGDAGAVLDASDWTNQSIQAEIKPTAVSTSGTDRWVGLMTRRSDASNYYYVTLRASGVIQLKRRVGGVFTTLASATFPWTLNRNYRLRLESAGDLHQVYVDGVKLLSARDSQLTHGRAGLLSYRTAADFDNVIVAPAPLATIWAQTQGEVCQPACVNRGPWWRFGGGQWAWTAEGVFHQGVASGSTRAFIGAPTPNKDQIVEARVRPTTFGTPADAWAGIMLGYVGPGDYVYLSLRKSNTLRLHRLRGGQATLLGSAPLTVTPGAWYTLRLEQVANRLRGYVNGVQKFEVVQDQWNAGQVGLVTYATAADYDDLNAVRP
jgi:hypothetical protein